MNIPNLGWVIVCKACDERKEFNQRPHELFYFDLDWACTDAKEMNEDHPGHKVVAVEIIRKDESSIDLWHDHTKVAHACICTQKDASEK